MHSELRFRRLFETAQDGILVLLADSGEVTDLNPSLVKLLGYDKEEMVGRSLPALPLFKNPVVAVSLLDQVRTSKVALLDNLSIQTRDGKAIAVEISATLYREGDQQLIQCHFRDIRHRKNAEELEDRIRQAQKMEAVGLLAGGIAHDFNNLLAVILGYCDALENSGLPDSAVKMVREIQKAGDSAKDLTQRLLIFSRRQPAQPQHINLNHVITGMERMLGRTIGADIELLSHLAPDLGTIHADPAQLEQVLLNLCINARDAMPGGGKIFVETENFQVDQALADEYPHLAPGPHVSLTVRDTGSGIDPAIREHIFQPFFSTKAPGYGTGLGLSTVFAIVRKANGAIGVHSEIGQGTTFRIFIPRSQQAPVTRAAEPPPANCMGGSETILLVDDADPVRALTKRILEGSGYTVLDSGDPAQALQMFKQHSGEIPLVITDVVMPGLNGFVLGSRILALRPATKILYVSGYNRFPEQSISDEHVSMLEKPYSRSGLLKKVRSLLDTP